MFEIKYLVNRLYGQGIRNAYAHVAAELGVTEYYVRAIYLGNLKPGRKLEQTIKDMYNETIKKEEK